MRKPLALLAATVVAATAVVALPAAAFAARDIPTTPCEIQDFLGVDNVMACEGVDG